MKSALSKQIQSFQLILDKLQINDQSLVHCDQARSIVRSIGDRLVVNIDRLDIHCNTTKQIPEWEPELYLRNYQTLKKEIFDIETTGGVNNPLEEARSTDLIMIGSKDEYGVSSIISRHNYINYNNPEKQMLNDWLERLYTLMPNLLIGFNCIKFDLLYLIGKFNQHGIKHPFYVSDYVSTFRTAQKNGQPFRFNAVHIKINGQKIHVIDCYPLVLNYDFVARSMSAHSLKVAPLELDLRKEARLDLGFQGILEAYHTGNYDLLAEYLEYDLVDTELLANFLIPDVYNQQLFCNEFPLQSLATMGNATKWNSTLKNLYSGIEPVADEKKSFIGGKVFYLAGLYPFTSKFDVASLYPSIQRKYGICSIKDEKYYSLAIIGYGRKVRLGYKTLKLFITNKFEGDPVVYLKTYISAIKTCLGFARHTGEAENVLKQLLDALEQGLTTGNLDPLRNELRKLPKSFFKNEGSIKLYLNSSYGFLNTTGTPYNDPIAGCLVTAYGRKILSFMADEATKLGAVVVGRDTDAIMITTDSFERNEEIYQKLSAMMPEGIQIEHELKSPFVYIPPVENMVDFDKNYVFKDGKIDKDGTVKPSLARKFFDKVFSDEDPKEVEIAWKYTLAMYPGLKVTFDRIYTIARKFNLTFPSDEGLRKNFLVFLPDKDGNLKAKPYGRYRKRDKSILEKTFHIEYLLRYVRSEVEADEYYHALRNELLNGNYDIEKLKIHRKIRKGETTLIQLGIGNVGDMVDLYEGEGGKNIGGYNIEHYVKLLDEQYSELQTAKIIMKEKIK